MSRIRRDAMDRAEAFLTRSLIRLGRSCGVRNVLMSGEASATDVDVCPWKNPNHGHRHGGCGDCAFRPDASARGGFVGAAGRAGYRGGLERSEGTEARSLKWTSRGRSVVSSASLPAVCTHTEWATGRPLSMEAVRAFKVLVGVENRRESLLAGPCWSQKVWPSKPPHLRNLGDVRPSGTVVCDGGKGLTADRKKFAAEGAHHVKMRGTGPATKGWQILRPVLSLQHRPARAACRSGFEVSAVRRRR
ncbi:hypothetical protein L1887_55852 [Cichorium endivia]|nr:hypothetical protein L1887_55852 [Cichorium endivia]